MICSACVNGTFNFDGINGYCKKCPQNSNNCILNKVYVLDGYWRYS
jgi:hypothetical protein